MEDQHAMLCEEKECFRRVSNGDQNAFAMVFYHYTTRLYPFVKKMTRSDEATEEIVQEVFMSVWNNRHKLADVQNHSAYIYTIAANKTYTFLAVKCRKEQQLKEFRQRVNGSVNNPYEAGDLREFQEVVNQLVTNLPPQRRLIFKLTREEGLSHDEVAQQLNISKNTVKNHLIETLRYLRRHLLRDRALMLIFALLH